MNEEDLRILKRDVEQANGLRKRIGNSISNFGNFEGGYDDQELRFMETSIKGTLNAFRNNIESMINLWSRDLPIEDEIPETNEELPF